MNHTEWVRITSCDNIPAREGRAAIVGGREIAIFNIGGGFLAVDNRCPHRGGPLADGIVAGSTVVCPLHAWKIDLHTGSVGRPSGLSTCVRALVSHPRRGRNRDDRAAVRGRSGCGKWSGRLMTTRADGFLRSGHLPTLVAALLYFDVSFMAWVMLGPLAPFLREAFGLSATQQGLLVAIPLLGGSLFRPVLGVLADRLGGRRTGLLGLGLTLLPLALAWKVADSPAHLYALGFLLGIGGASFAVALPLASRWYPPQYQGLVMGIAGAGNSGSLVATLLAPRLAERFGWANTFGLMILPVVAVMILFTLLAKDSPRRSAPPAWRDYADVLREPDTFWFAFLYGLTFGGFVGFTSFLTTFFHQQYQVSRVSAGDFTTIVVISGSLLRPVGGWLSDRIGGYRLLLALLVGVAACFVGVASLPPLRVVVTMLFLGVGLLGMGNGAVFQLVPQRFGDRLGMVTGVVGAAGGLGGFCLPSVLGIAKDATGSYAPGLLCFAVACFAGSMALLRLGSRWTLRWRPDAVQRSGIFCYRGVVRRLLGAQTA
jgi:NNP family nitrate/nitrite transporter-like MFS transporter